MQLTRFCVQQRKEENGSKVAMNRSESRSADDEVHTHQTRLLAQKSNLEKKKEELEGWNSAADPEELLAQKCAELQETVDALERQDGECGKVRDTLKRLRDEIEKAQTALDKHDEQEVGNPSGPAHDSVSGHFLLLMPH